MPEIEDDIGRSGPQISRNDNPYLWGNDHERIRRKGPSDTRSDGPMEKMTPEDTPWFAVVWKQRKRYWWFTPSYLWEWSDNLDTALKAPKPSTPPPKLK